MVFMTVTKLSHYYGYNELLQAANISVSTGCVIMKAYSRMWLLVNQLRNMYTANSIKVVVSKA